MPEQQGSLLLGGPPVNDQENSAVPASTVTRRQLIAGLATALGSLAVGSEALANTQQAPKEKPGAAADKIRTSLHQEITFNANPQRIYEALLASKQFSALTGLSAEIDPKGGGAFTMFGGLIVGRNVELIPNQRIVQAWRPTHWDPGIYSIVKFELERLGSETKVVLDHRGFPEGEFDSLNSGWKQRYWDPLKKFLA
jgi:activator of HSP90 ATPase